MITVIDFKTGDNLRVKKIKDKCRITVDNKYHDLTSEEIGNRQLSEQLEYLQKELLDKQNNIEAVMF